MPAVRRPVDAPAGRNSRNGRVGAISRRVDPCRGCKVARLAGGRDIGAGQECCPELLVVDESLRRRKSRRAVASEIKIRHDHAGGMASLREDGVAQGIGRRDYD